MCCECEVVDDTMSIMTGPQHSCNLKVYDRKFMNTIEATHRGHHHGYSEKYMEVEGSCHVFLDQCSRAKHSFR